MQPDPKIPSLSGDLPSGNAPPPSPAAQPPALDAPPPLTAGSPPLPLPEPTPRGSSTRQAVAILLSLCLGLFIADGVVSLVDDSLILFLGIHPLTVLRGMICLFAVLMAIPVYALMGLTPMIPKRLFLPVTLFEPAAALALIPCMIYFYGRMQQMAWVISLCQVVCGLGILYAVQGGIKFRWPLIPTERLAAWRFNWRNLYVFVLLNLFGLLPAVVLYLVLSAALAVNHFSEGFLALRPGGLTVQVRKYVRNDGKTIQLFPMSHVGEPDFYRELAQSFPTNSIILMEGVTDRRNLLTNKISYKRMAASLGVAEQQQEFNPTRGELVWADVDIEQFTTNTLGLLNVAMLIHSKGVNAETVMKLMSYSPPPHLEEQLLEDLLRKRNRHLLEEIQAWLPQTEHIIVPWGVAHMPGIAEGIQGSGFRLAETREYVAIRFRSVRNETQGARKEGDSGKPQ